MGDGERMEEEKEGDQHPPRTPFQPWFRPCLYAVLYNAQTSVFCELPCDSLSVLLFNHN